LFAVLLAAWFLHNPVSYPDFGVFFSAATALRRGIDPYANSLAADWANRFLYPLPAIVPLVPLTWLPVDVAQMIFVGLSAFALGFAIEHSGNRWLFLTLLSQSFIASAAVGQWSILLLAAFFLPRLNAVSVIKPNVGVALAASWTSWRQLQWAVAGAVALCAVAFALEPGWIAPWLTMVRGSPVLRSSVSYPGGILVLAAAFRWRRPEARWLLALAVVPQSPGLYTDLLLFAVPRTKWEVVGLTLLTYVPLKIAHAMPHIEHLGEITRYGSIAVPVLLVPCVLMVLRRPNEGPAPAWLERRLAGAPRWLRGRSDVARDAIVAGAG